MSFLSRLFGKRATNSQGHNNRSFREKDNMGTRHDTFDLSFAYWMTRQTTPKKDPFVMYIFDREGDARAALLELPCIRVAEDSRKLICTETLIFGYYPRGDGKYEAIVCGDDLTHELWEQARASFAKHKGVRKNDLEPTKRVAPATTAKTAQPGRVVFVKETRQQKAGATYIYRVHKGPDEHSAKTFLEKNPVAQQHYYIVVETPQGNYCRDVLGMYKE